MRIKPNIGAAARLMGPLLVVVLSAGCSLKNEENISPSGTRILFEVFHVNWAWGFQCGGYYVDDEGAVWRFDCRALADSAARHHTHEGDFLSHRHLLEYDIIGQIQGDTLTWARQLLSLAALEPPLERRQSSYDFGSQMYYGYMKRSIFGDWEQIPLATVGDWSHDPSTSAARTLVNWLQEIGKTYR